MKKVIFVLSLILGLAVSCTGMDENYKDYLNEKPTYAPCIVNLKANSPEVGSLTLSWELPKGERAKSIKIVCHEASDISTTVSLELVTSYTFEDLKLQGYTFDIYTIDIFGNYSIPVTATFTPIPGRE